MNSDVNSDEEEEEEDSRPIKKKQSANAKSPTDQPRPRGRPPKNPKTPSISQLLGKRRCAAEASDKIRVQQTEVYSGNSSGNEDPGASTPKETGSRGRPKRGAKRSLEMNLEENGGKNRSPPSSGARSKRRRAVDDQVENMFNPTVLEDLLNAMMKHRDGWPFDRPITKAEAPDYHKIIKRPIDLGTIRSSINRMKYTCNQEVIEDIQLVFANCWTYNRDDAEEYQCGKRLEKYFKKEAKKLKLLNDEEDEDDDKPLARPAKKARRTL